MPDDAPRHRERVPRAGERHQHVGDAEVGVAVEQDRPDVHADEHDGQRAEVAVQAEQPRGPRPAAEHLGGEQQPPHDGGEDQGPGDDAARPGDVPGDLAHRSAPSACWCATLPCDDDACVDDVLALDDVSEVVAARLGRGRARRRSSRRSCESSTGRGGLLGRARGRRSASVVVACPSRQASAPPSESIVATLSAVAALRARAARGLRRGRPRSHGGGERVGGAGGSGVGSSMTVNVRTGGERAARGG